jgi:hypothetical protein
MRRFSSNGPRIPPVEASLRPQLTAFNICFALVLLLGIFARVWEFDSLPPGLRADETLAAVDAHSLYNHGIDHNGDPFPLVFVGGGGGVISALYEYLLIPSIAIGGMNAVSVRMPVLIAGLLALPFFYYLGLRIGGRSLGLIAMFLLAISPWHILASRRGIESNLLPFVFLIAFAALLKSLLDNRWFIGAAALFALCMYTYAQAYAGVPLFLALALAILFLTRRVRPEMLVVGTAVFAVLVAPIGLFLLINQLKLSTVHLGPFTVPRLPSKPRFETMTVLFSPEVVHTLKTNAIGLASLLWKQSDGHPWNSVDPYGYFYRYSLPVAAIGSILFVPLRNFKASAERLLVLAWLAAAACLGLIQPANINRIDLIFMPLLLCVALCLDWLWRHSKATLVAAVLALLVGFVLFSKEYHGPRYRYQADFYFYDGFMQAMNFARQASSGPICVTNEGVDEPFVFALFLEQMNPADYLPDLVYVNPHAEFRRPLRFGRYHFGVEPCEVDSHDAVYVLNQSERLADTQSYSVHSFGNFHVYTP